MDKTANNGLKELHKLHIQLREVQEELDRGPKQVKARGQFTLQKQDELEAQKQKQKTLKMAADQKSLQLKSNEAKILELKGKLNAASSNREFDIIKSQIEADSMANSVLEDEILNHLEKVDAAQIAVRKLEAELAAAKLEETRASEKITSSMAELNSRALALQQEIASAESVLPAEIAVVYRRLVKTYGAGALAEVDGSICSSCYVGLPPQMAVALKAGQIMFCKTCGRLLYQRGDE